MYVVYTGDSDLRVLNASDLQKIEVEGFKKTTFTKGQPVELDDSVAEALTKHSLFSYEFAEVQPDKLREFSPFVPMTGAPVARDESTEDLEGGVGSAVRGTGRGATGGGSGRAAR